MFLQRKVLHEMAAKVNISDSELKRMRDTVLAQQSSEIIALARQNLELLGEYEITETTLTETDEALQMYNSKISAPGKSISSRKAGHEKLSALFKQGDVVLKKHLDAMIKMYRDSHPEFYNTYKNSRKLPREGIRHNEGESQEPSTTA